MELIEWFGGEVTRLALTNPARARRLLLTGYRANLAALHLPAMNPQLSPGRRYAAITVMKVIIRSLSRGENGALVSLFTPCEPLSAAGIAPYSLEAVSGYLAGTHCETRFQENAVEHGSPDTLCSYHRTFCGAAETGLLPPPRFIVYTSLACDGNMVTFPYLAKKFDVPCFFIDVPYEKSEDAVQDVARQLAQMKTFVEDVTHRRVTDEALRAAVRRSRVSAETYLRYLAAERERRLPDDATGEMFAAFMARILLGTPEAETYFSRIAQDIGKAPLSRAKRLVWVHAIPNMQPSLRRIMNFSDKAFITGCELCYDSLFIPQDENDPYGSMARRLVYSGYNGSYQGRVDNALRMAKLTDADGAVIFAHFGCKATLGAAQLMKAALEAQGLPALVLDGDACSPASTGDGQLATRLEAFLEMLEAAQ